MSKPTLSHTTDDGSNSLMASSSRQGASDSATTNIKYLVLMSFRPWGSGKIIISSNIAKSKETSVKYAVCLWSDWNWPNVCIRFLLRTVTIMRWTFKTGRQCKETSPLLQQETHLPMLAWNLACFSDFFTKWIPPVQITVWKCHMWNYTMKNSATYFANDVGSRPCFPCSTSPLSLSATSNLLNISLSCPCPLFVCFVLF